MKTLDSPYVFFELMDNGLLIASYKKGLRIDLQMAKSIVDSRLHFTAGRSLPVLIRNHGVSSMNREARLYFSSEAGTKAVKAGALVLESVFSQLLGNFLLSVNGPPIPARIFKEEDKALHWLEAFLDPIPPEKSD